MSPVTWSTRICPRWSRSTTMSRTSSAARAGCANRKRPASVDQADELSLRDDLRPIGFADYADAELFGFLELRACTRARDDQIGLGTDRARRARAEAFGLGLGLVAAHGFEGAGEDDGLAGPFGLLGVADERRGRHFGQEIVERVAVVRLVEEIDQRLGDDRADALDRGQLGLRVVRGRDAPQFFDRTEALEQILGGDDADVADAEAEQEAWGLGRALGVDRGEEVVDALLFPPLAAEQISAVFAQAENVGGRMEPAQFNELEDRPLAKPLDVERAARHEMAQAFEALGRAD